MKFLSAEWRKLAIINYEINPEILQKYLPKNVELDFYEGKCLVSVVGFMFQNTKVLGLSVPFHRNFEEVNLRFYVKKFIGGNWRRGVVFIKEIVPKKTLSLVANSIYKEHYETLPMAHIFSKSVSLDINYFWGENFGNFIKIHAENSPQKMVQNSEFEFITENYFGYTIHRNSTSEYEVRHPKWDYYNVESYSFQIDFEKNYGKDFSLLNHQKPHSVMLAEGSKIEVHFKRRTPEFDSRKN